MAQHPRPSNPPPVAAPFGPEMVQGSVPPTNRQLLGPRIPLPVTQTDQPVGLSPEMMVGSAPDRPTHYLKGPLFLQAPTQATQVNAPFGNEMTRGYHPDQPILGKPVPQGWQWWTSDVPSIIVEQAQGSHPDQPRVFLAPRFQQPPVPLTAVPLFSPEMARGVSPPTPVLSKPEPIGWNWLTPEVFVFSIEEVIGSHPDSPRLFLPPRFQQPPSQTTQIDAPFSIETVRGVIPPRPILGKPQPLGLFAWVSDLIPFSIEEVVGSHPDRPRLFSAPRFMQPPFPIVSAAAPFSIEMTQGSQVPPFRLWPYVARFAVLLEPIVAPTPPTFAGRWAPVGYVLHTREQGTGTFFAQLVMADLVTPLPGSLLTSLQLTLYTINQDDSITIINGRNQQNVLNANGGTVAPSGAITWTYLPGDTMLIDPTIPFERHIALFEWTWPGGSSKTEVILVVQNLRRVP